jgi:DNA-binding MarR family transcriptional regulator
MDKYEVLKIEKQLCFPLYAAAKAVVAKYTPSLEALDLTYTQYIAMMVIWEKGSLSSRELGKALFLDSGTLTPLLKKLEDKGFITRKRSEEDARNLMISVTAKGLELRERALDVPEKVGSCISLDQDEAAELYRLLYKLLASEEKN